MQLKKYCFSKKNTQIEKKRQLEKNHGIKMVKII